MAMVPASALSCQSQLQRRRRRRRRRAAGALFVCVITATLQFYHQAIMLMLAAVVVDGFLTPYYYHSSSSFTSPHHSASLMIMPPPPSSSRNERRNNGSSSSRRSRPIATTTATRMEISNGNNANNNDATTTAAAADTTATPEEENYLLLANDIFDATTTTTTAATSSTTTAAAAAAAKENYLLLANEAYQKYYSKQKKQRKQKRQQQDDDNKADVDDSALLLSQEEYLKLALSAWNDSSSSSSTSDGIRKEEDVADGVDGDGSTTMNDQFTTATTSIDEIADQLIEPPVYATSSSSSTSSGSSGINGSNGSESTPSEQQPQDDNDGDVSMNNISLQQSSSSSNANDEANGNENDKQQQLLDNKSIDNTKKSIDDNPNAKKTKNNPLDIFAKFVGDALSSSSPSILPWSSSSSSSSTATSQKGASTSESFNEESGDNVPYGLRVQQQNIAQKKSSNDNSSNKKMMAQTKMTSSVPKSLKKQGGDGSGDSDDEQVVGKKQSNYPPLKGSFLKSNKGIINNDNIDGSSKKSFVAVGGGGMIKKASNTIPLVGNNSKQQVVVKEKKPIEPILNRPQQPLANKKMTDDKNLEKKGLTTTTTRANVSSNSSAVVLPSEKDGAATVAATAAADLESNPKQVSLNRSSKMEETETDDDDDASSASNKMPADEPRRSKETEAAWIAEQNELAKKKLAARIAKEEEQKAKEEEDRIAAARRKEADFEKIAEETRRSKETEASWIAEQNELAKKKLAARIAREEELKAKEEADRIAAACRREAGFEKIAEETRRSKETEAWIAEQNVLVKKKLAERVANEKNDLKDEGEEEEEEEETDDAAAAAASEAESKLVKDESMSLEETEASWAAAAEQNNGEETSDGSFNLVTTAAGTTIDNPAAAQKSSKGFFLTPLKSPLPKIDLGDSKSSPKDTSSSSSSSSSSLFQPTPKAAPLKGADNFVSGGKSLQISSVVGPKSMDSLKGATTKKIGEGPNKKFGSLKAKISGNIVSPQSSPKQQLNTIINKQITMGGPKFIDTLKVAKIEGLKKGLASSSSPPPPPQQQQQLNTLKDKQEFRTAPFMKKTPTKGTIGKAEGPMKGFAFGSLKAKKSDGISPQLPPPQKVNPLKDAMDSLKGTAQSEGPVKGLGFGSLFTKKSGGISPQSSPKQLNTLKDPMDSLKGTANSEGPVKGFAFGSLKAKKSDGISPQLSPQKNQLNTLKAPLESLKDTAKTEGPKKGLAFGSLNAKKSGGISPQLSPPQQLNTLKAPLDSLKGTAKSEGPKKGLTFGSLNAKKSGGISPQSSPKQLNTLKDELESGTPFMKKSPTFLKGSAQITGKEIEQPGVVGFDAFNKSKKGVPPESNGPPPAFLAGLKQSPKVNQINSSNDSTESSVMSTSMPVNKGMVSGGLGGNSSPNEGSGFPMGFNAPLDLKGGLAPKEEEAAEAPLNFSAAAASSSSLGLQDPKRSTPMQNSDFETLSDPASTSPSTESLVNIENSAAPANFAGSELAEDGAASPVSAYNTDDGAMVLTEADEPWLALGDDPILPLFHVGNRIRSSVHGTTHGGYLVLSMEGSNDGVQSNIPNSGNRYRVMPCIAKRPWSMDEINATVPTKVLAFEQQQYNAIEEAYTPESWELDAKAAVVRRIYEVEIHIHQKFAQKRTLYEQLSRQKQQDEKERGGTKKDENDDSTINNLADIAVQKFLRVYPDDGSGGPRVDDAIPEYGATGLDVWGKALSVGHEWLVYEGKLDTELTLLDAMEKDQNIQNVGRHNLFGIQQAMNLPENYEFGDVLDTIARSLLENLVFLSACNIVHRDLRPGNILCDGETQRLQLTNFGNAVDLDPPRVGLENDNIEVDAPGSIANTLAVDVFSVALIVLQMLFGISYDVVNQQLKDAGYDLDLWLQKGAIAESRPIEFGQALDYLGERPGFWSLLKGAIRPNPMRKKITADSLRQFNEVMGLKSGETLTDEKIEKIARDESYLNSVIDPSSSRDELHNDIAMEATTRDSPSDEAFDITRVIKPRTKSSVSTLSELSRKAEQSALTAKTSNEASKEAAVAAAAEAAALAASSDEAFDVTQLKFSPTRKSLLTDMLASYAEKKRANMNVRQKRKESLPGGKYYDITRAPFQRVSPQPSKMIDEAAVRASATIIPKDKPDKRAIEVIQIVCPSGKLGVVVDTPPTGGPAYVSNISDNSPLRNQIFLGDTIIAVDDEEVLDIGPDDISRILLSKSANALRKITLLREIVPTGSDASIDETVYGAEETKQSNPEQQVGRTDTGKDATLLTQTQTLFDEKRNEEVEGWLLYYLPSLQRQDIKKYCRCLSEDGFDSLEMMDELLEEDFYFMKKAHQRVMARKLSGPTGTKTQASSSAPDQQLQASKKVFKVEEVLGEAARKGIQAKIAEQKRLATESRSAVEKAEVDRKTNKVKRAKVDEETRLQTFEQHEMKELERQMESEAAAIRAKARQVEFEKLAEEARRLKETEAWIAEQNELVKKKHAARIAKEKQLKAEEKRYTARQAKFEKLEEEARRSKETEAWIAKQNELVKERHRERTTKENHLTEDEETDAAASELDQLEDEARRLGESDAWIAEQNELVTKRHLARIAAENHLKEEEETKKSDVTETNSNTERNEAPTKALQNCGNDIASTNQFHVITEGLTAEEAELVRKYRLEVADNEAKKMSGKVQLQSSIPKTGKSEIPAETNHVKSRSDQVIDEDERESWLDEQNRLVEKRRIARLDQEKQPKDDS